MYRANKFKQKVFVYTASINDIVKPDDDSNKQIENIKAKLRSLPNDPELHASLGNLLCANKQIDDGREHYQLAIDNRPSDKSDVKGNDYVNLAITYVKDNPFKMVEYLQLALKEDGDNIPANMGGYHLQRGKMERARPYIITAYNTASIVVMSFNTENMDHEEKVQAAAIISPYYYRSILYQLDRDMKQAMQCAEVAAKVAPSVYGQYLKILKEKCGSEQKMIVKRKTIRMKDVSYASIIICSRKYIQPNIFSSN